MTFEQIQSYELINEIDEERVKEIASSIKKIGWLGCPILVTEMGLLTGSHRLTALQLLNENEELDLTMNVAEDVTELVNEAFARFEEEEGYAPELEYDNLGWIFEGTWVAEHKNEIEEW